MAQTDSISLEDLRSASSELSSPDHEQAVSISSQARTRQMESRKRRAFVLLGSSLIQLPVWGFAMSYGVFQEYYNDNWTLQGSSDLTGIIGTTSNGVMYLSMPFLFVLFTYGGASTYRQRAAILGAILGGVSFILSSFSTHAWHLVLTQGVLAALGCTLVFSATTLSLGEWFSAHHRAVAYGVTLSSKNIVGSTCPFLFRSLLLDRYGFRVALRAWAGIVIGTAVLAILLIPSPPTSSSANMAGRDGRDGSRPRRTIPWSFLRHRTFYIYAIACVLQSAGYGLPQTYVSAYAREVAALSQTSATLMLTLFNIPGIASSSFFGYLSDNKYLRLSAMTVTSISATSSALAVFLFWGLATKGSLALLILFSMTFGFFAGGYSATWGGVIDEMEKEAVSSNEAIDTGIVYGLLNGARGIGYVSGGLVGVPLLKAGAMTSLGKFAYGTAYGPLIIFTGISVFGGSGVIWKWMPLRWHSW